MTTRQPDGRGAALVTGASRGIGRCLALLLAERGFSVGVNYRAGSDAAAEVVKIIHDRGGTAVALQADLSDPEQASDLVDRAADELGPLVALVNNAGITRDRLVMQMSDEDWHATWDTDLLGPRAAARQVVFHMRTTGPGRIVNVSSVVGSTGNAGQANYAAAKAGLVGFSRQLAVEVAADGIAVNCVIPGFIDTDATAHLTDSQRDTWIQRIPMNRSATPDEVAEVIAWLAADCPTYVTGQCVAVDGGLLASAGYGFAS